MKLKKVLCFGMAVVLACSGLPQTVVYGQEVAQRDILASEEDFYVDRETGTYITTGIRGSSGTDTTPGDASKPGTDITPGDASRPGTDITPGDASRPGTDVTPGDANKPGADTDPGEEQGKCNHQYQERAQRAASCTMDGRKYFVCRLCGYGYVEKTSVLPHEYETVVEKKAAFQKDGISRNICSVCGKEGEKSVIPAVKAVKLSATEFVWDGSICKPSVVVLDKKGKELKAGTDYTLEGSGGSSTVGFHTITVKFQGDYTGSIGKIYRILPKAASIQKVTKISKGFTLKWKKQAKEITGYEIQYSTNKKFTSKASKTVQIKKKTTTKKTIKNLKGKKTYYVRIRTYKKVSVNGKTRNMYSSWSSMKKVKTKK